MKQLIPIPENKPFFSSGRKSVTGTNLTYIRTNGLCVENKIIYAIFESDFNGKSTFYRMKSKGEALATDSPPPAGILSGT
jgi:hypothetical protein